MGPLAELVERLVGASSGKTALDEAVFEIAHGRSVQHSDYWNGLPPSYTISVDAALTLIPAGWRTDTVYEYRDCSKWVWALRRKDEGDLAREKQVGAAGTAATAALALCVAALRARLAG